MNGISIFSSLSQPTLESANTHGISTNFDTELKVPELAKALLTNNVIETVSRAQFEHGWKARKQITGEQHENSNNTYESLPQNVKDFIFALTLGKLSYYPKFVTREGFEAMINVGQSADSLKQIENNSILTSNLNEPVQSILARLHHENWLNQNAILEKPHTYNYEWNDFPDDLPQAHLFSKIQVDMDCRALATLGEQELNILRKLFKSGDGKQFFHQLEEVSVRAELPVMPLNPGRHFLKPLTADAFISIVKRIAKNPASSRYYAIHQSILDSHEVPHKERKILEALIYEDGEKKSDTDCQKIISIAKENLNDNILQLTSDEVAQFVHNKLSPNKLLSKRLTLHEAFDEFFLANWHNHLSPQFKHLASGFKASESCSNNQKEDIDFRKSYLHEQMSSGMLEIILSYPRETVNQLRLVGKIMHTSGVKDLKQEKWVSNQAIPLQSGASIKINPILLEQLVNKRKLLTLNRNTSNQLLPEGVRPNKLKGSDKKRLASPTDINSSPRHQILNCYAFALALGTLSDDNYKTIQEAYLE